jgi:hypothetical protein
MKRSLVLAVAFMAAFAFTGQAANAGARHTHYKKEIVAASVVTGAAATATYFAINDWKWKWDNASGFTSAGAIVATTIGCAALSPMLATVLLKRPLTNREAGILIGSCIVPIVGGWLVNAAYDAHPEWEPGYVVPVADKRHHRR